jgi:hypothetical protein
MIVQSNQILTNGIFQVMESIPKENWQSKYYAPLVVFQRYKGTNLNIVHIHLWLILLYFTYTHNHVENEALHWKYKKIHKKLKHVKHIWMNL